MTQQPLRRKLYRRQWILDLVRDALRHFLPRRRLLRPQQVRQIVNHHHKSRIRSPRPQRTHRHRRAHQPPRRRHFNLARSHAHPQRLPHQVQHRPRRLFPQQILQSPRLPRASPRIAGTAEFSRATSPDEFSDTTPVGIFSRIASINFRRRSRSSIACSRLCVNSLICRRPSPSCSVMRLNERTSIPSSSCARTSIR